MSPVIASSFMKRSQRGNHPSPFYSRQPRSLEQVSRAHHYICCLVYIVRLSTLEDEHDNTPTEIRTFINRVVAATAPGSYLTEVFPWMMYIPER
jgi:hypothetical protein